MWSKHNGLILLLVKGSHDSIDFTAVEFINEYQMIPVYATLLTSPMLKNRLISPFGFIFEKKTRVIEGAHVVSILCLRPIITKSGHLNFRMIKCVCWQWLWRYAVWSARRLVNWQNTVPELAMLLVRTHIVTCGQCYKTFYSRNYVAIGITQWKS